MNNDEPHQAKRARLDDAPDALPPVRSDIWFDDGNIVLQAEDTQFRVHRGVLTRASEVFRDMFALPQPGTVDACPLVVLSDSAAQLEWVLRALYADRKYADDVPLAAVAAYIRLGRKYAFDALYHDTVKLVTQQLPADLVEFERRSCHIDPAPAFAFAALCAEEDIRIALPAALYLCTLTTFKSIMKSALPEDVKAKVVIGKEALAGTGSGFIDDSSSCVTSAECDERRIELADMARQGVKRAAFAPWDEFWVSFLCEECQGASKASWRKERKALWASLPLYFELPPWTELKKDPYPR